MRSARSVFGGGRPCGRPRHSAASAAAMTICRCFGFIRCRHPQPSSRRKYPRTGLSPRIIERLADADAFGSLGLTRRQALWAAKALGRVGGSDDDLPLFRVHTMPASAAIVAPKVKEQR